MKTAAPFLAALILAAALAPHARAEDLTFEQVVLEEGKGPNPSLLYVVLTEPDFKKCDDLVVRYAKAALKEAADRKFKGVTTGTDRPKYEGNVVFLIRTAKGESRGIVSGFSVDQLQEMIQAEPARALQLASRHAWSFGTLPGAQPKQPAQDDPPRNVETVPGHVTARLVAARNSLERTHQLVVKFETLDKEPREIVLEFPSGDYTPHQRTLMAVVCACMGWEHPVSHTKWEEAKVKALFAIPKDVVAEPGRGVDNCFLLSLEPKAAK
jgi:hypothetical protein